MENQEIKVLSKDEITSVLTNKLSETYDRVEDMISLYDDFEDWRKAGVTKKDRLVRIRFWRMMDECLYEDKVLSVRRLIGGVYSKTNFYKALKSDIKAAFIFTKPLDHRIEDMELLEVANDRISKILDLPIYDERGKLLSAVLNAQIRVYSMLKDRVQGQTVQRIQQHTVQENRSKTSAITDMKAIDAEIARISEKTDILSISESDQS